MWEEVALFGEFICEEVAVLGEFICEAVAGCWLFSGAATARSTHQGYIYSLFSHKNKLIITARGGN